MGGRWTSPNRRPKKRFLGSIFTKEEQGISLIGEGSSVVGTLHFGDGVVRLDGRLDGGIFGQGTLIIGPEGLFQGEMKVSTLILCGRVEGTVIASERAHITPTGKLLGRVQAAQLIIEEGGILDGKSEKWEGPPIWGQPES
ncbi:MAG: polymer-forming cytoskeletal protein [Proteobacteria bacterium]|nr:polymer-forming cytoskeletal protein [Pseudomonadota bacterium]